MPKSAACNINGQEGERSPSVCLRVCVCECRLIESFAAYLAGGFLQLSHSSLLTRNRARSQNTASAAAALAL